MSTRRTLARETSIAGTALHSGATVKMALSPASAGVGIVFRRADRDNAMIPARYDAVTETNLGTVISNGEVSVGVIEHLMAAAAGAGVDDMIVTVDGPEPPILDGDALAYYKLLEQAGFNDVTGWKKAIKVTKPVEVAIKDATIRLLPSEKPEYSYDLDYSNTKAIGKQSYTMTLDRESFAREIAPARTFGFMHELAYLKSIDRGHGASLENTLAIDGDNVVNKDLMRFPDEFVRHKILDAIGDMALAGSPLIARFEGVKSGHATNNAVLRKLFADPTNYVTIDLA
ncbi:MAG: UDP-3-O-[3-hydroxymyristoyl] N-acetylglucosamine deacetylase [Alphaproteobacteria bacterium]|nr:UDP-3-O-[3-hydroxymyristoyl] N-acetylglucosamine deacetylase [Alphaproteobacteria bacterium]MBV9419634.1 UDP-3-O-[3-hydroxymyristoyl] N-acetylglucosamine deacetylase [Alphaproteobacteria bacterium]MBV9540456.1 UDP-3-O-[3-hydroxymyristoyl] N-acetylglucosamine deacetylase [Alphaproteobacteria bacterium]MBV9904324.1 UDP-3-O-[3-hydroxymyristoyl] N-acetylglucosamine deacetylase [Alphaproteobacteria bacterium]